jgi:hypothetical protein
MVPFMGLKDRAKQLAQQAKEIGTDLQQRGATAVQHATEAVRGGRVDPSTLLSVEVITKATGEVTTRQPNDMQDGCTTAVWRGPTWRVWLNVYHPTAQEGGQATPEWATQRVARVRSAWPEPLPLDGVDEALGSDDPASFSVFLRSGRVVAMIGATNDPDPDATGGPRDVVMQLAQSVVDSVKAAAAAGA